jgi:nicotinate-nucleotide adenylyltransferase
VKWVTISGGGPAVGAIERTYTAPMPSAPPSPAAGGPPRRRLALLGGTFDPPHVGHVAVAAIVRHALGLEELWLVVANRPWQKAGVRLVTPAADRLAMAEAAVSGIEGVSVSAAEIDRGGDSYTADTLAALRTQWPQQESLVVVGADAAAGLPTWERAEEVRVGATLVLVDRPGIASAGLPPGWTFVRVEVPRIDVSSTDLRRRVRDGEPVDGLVPPAVRATIEERGLYRDRRQ